MTTLHPASRTPRKVTTTGQPAFVLHGWSWSETSLILDLFTREAGRVAVAAKGAKRPYSQMRSVLMPFQRIVVHFGRTRGDETADVHNLRSAEWAGQGVSLSGGDWFSGFYLNELLMRLLPRDDPHPRLFDVYALTLLAMSHASAARMEAALRAFELLLLRETGVLPELDRVTHTQSPVAGDAAYQVRPEEGVVEVVPGPSSLPARVCAELESALRAVQSEPGAERLEQLLAAAVAAGPALKTQLRQQLHYHLAGTTLRTRQVMIEAYRLLGLDAAAAAR
jgi:DNA repair protein RecO (recombination protein O)